MNHNETPCDCGQPHEHDHSHEHNCGCGCGCHAEEPRGEAAERSPLSETQAAFLDYLNHYGCLPVARFLMTSSKSEDFVVESLAPAFLQTAEDTLEQVREMGALLSSLEEGGHLSIDYDLPLSGYPYTEFRESELYAYFCKTVTEAAQQEGFLGDTPALELGSIAPL